MFCIVHSVPYVLFLRSISYVLQADMLLDGSYKTDMDKILTACKVARRNMVKKSLISVSGLVHQICE